jgi:hypothetical protein
LPPARKTPTIHPVLALIIVFERVDKIKEDPMAANEQTEETIRQTIDETEALRKKRSQIAAGTGMVILLAIAFLAIDLSLFAKNYDMEPVAEAIQKELPRLAESDEVQRMMKNVREQIIPTYIEALQEKMVQSKDLYHQECVGVLNTLEQEVGPAARDRVIAELTDIFSETEQLISAEYPDFTPQERTQILSALQTEIMEQYEERTAAQLTSMFGEISETLDSIKDDAVYQELATMDSATLERMLVTSSLELLIYEIDPNALNR